MNKILLSLAVVGALSSTAQAATSVQLYGQLDVGYEHWHTHKKVTQNSSHDSHIGLKGSEDLGNGLAATFNLEADIALDSGSMSSGFNRESTVGLKGRFGHVRVGVSSSAMDTAMDDLQDEGYGFVEYPNYTSLETVSNSLFYDFEKNGFMAGAHVSTKNGYDTDLTEAAKGGKIGWGAYAGYEADTYRVAAAYQRDGEAKEWGVSAAYQPNIMNFFASYASHKEDGLKTNVLEARAGVDVTPRDNISLRYNHTQEKEEGESSRTHNWGLGYAHAFSKRTSLYSEVAYRKGDTKGFDYGIRLRHSF
ncbi:MAG: porin [Formosimonas sp.]